MAKSAKQQKESKSSIEQEDLTVDPDIKATENIPEEEMADKQEFESGVFEVEIGEIVWDERLETNPNDQQKNEKI